MGLLARIPNQDARISQDLQLMTPGDTPLYRLFKFVKHWSLLGLKGLTNK